ncbi:MAG: hypothetical protein J07HN6_02746 [Halonotius sp. J07HN6]|nr:MAG: hypothetical protein J07HN6_02746 [Halonotius sp. J07HN6]
MTLRRRDGQGVFTAVTVAYLLVYLWGIGHLAAGLGGFSVTVVSDPLATLLRSEGAFSFRPVARIALGPLTYLASLNTLLGAGVAALVGLNLSLSYLAWRQPAACGIGRSSSGLLAGIPALLSGTACCGPVVLIVAGIQASSAVLTAFQFLLPAAVLMLVGSLLLVGRQVTVAQ